MIERIVPRRISPPWTYENAKPRIMEARNAATAYRLRRLLSYQVNGILYRSFIRRMLLATDVVATDSVAAMINTAIHHHLVTFRSFSTIASIRCRRSLHSIRNHPRAGRAASTQLSERR